MSMRKVGFPLEATDGIAECLTSVFATHWFATQDRSPDRNFLWDELGKPFAEIVDEEWAVFGFVPGYLVRRAAERMYRKTGMAYEIARNHIVFLIEELRSSVDDHFEFCDLPDAA